MAVQTWSLSEKLSILIDDLHATIAESKKLCESAQKLKWESESIGAASPPWRPVKLYLPDTLQD